MVIYKNVVRWWRWLGRGVKVVGLEGQDGLYVWPRSVNGGWGKYEEREKHAGSHSAGGCAGITAPGPAPEDHGRESELTFTREQMRRRATATTVDWTMCK